MLAASSQKSCVGPGTPRSRNGTATYIATANATSRDRVLRLVPAAATSSAAATATRSAGSWSSTRAPTGSAGSTSTTTAATATQAASTAASTIGARTAPRTVMGNEPTPDDNSGGTDGPGRVLGSSNSLSR